ncbi:hypothetical protein [Ruminococcus flavefaciens]|uniref:Lipoprotein n=1 Tax=Ruminococcus flavefaciens TaxID=1265 RepID=A0A315XZP7_RUMFL|nr:hypothetical protein [Ruminococcus flavefaciens]PWJ13371.1 hypothetical protein IE37_01172 [Ruminococcus flavefaciens]SSA47852.1 hypothetical protein SAMN02910325_01172 [Ruminococcus flavefaciens]
MKKTIAFMLACAMMCLSAGCLKKDDFVVSHMEIPPIPEPYTVEDGIFDVDAVRSNINIKGQHFDLPQYITKLGKEWDVKFYDKKEYGLHEGNAMASLYYNGTEMGTVMLENSYTHHEQESVMYSISVKTSDSSIYGITPLVSTIDDVTKLIGPPDDEQKLEMPFTHTYRYGIMLGKDEQGILRGHSIVISFNEDDVVDMVSITYSDMSETEEAEQEK